MSRRSVLAGLGAVGAFLAVDLGAVAYANRWIGPDGARTTFLNGFLTVYGRQLGFRKNHAKGVVVSGYFDSNGNGRELSSAAVFGTGRVPVVGRFSLSGGDPHMADATGAARGLGLAFGFPQGWQWRTAMLNLPVFPDNSPRGFYDRLLAAKADPETGKPDPAATTAFLAAHPETAAAMAVIKKHPPTAGFGDSIFRGLNTFYFVNEAGARTPVRWSFVPQQPALAPRKGDANGLFDALVGQLRDGPLRWRMLITVADAGDPVDDPTLPWPDDRRSIDVGTLTLTAAATEAAGNARDINFDPLVLPSGIEASEDPLLSARSDIYAASYRQRTGEPKSPSAVQVSEVRA
ncbi:catalase family peroxidase [Mycobacterium sp. CVI_P3]|uniref:Catalase-related peroxidase n=1 Tax=Mycobacterium pinniadriaticum TaxID=2994102 RepID=A0ABT3SNE3_9MYCO|nr:catalase family peroxidase [Mycobacterium pinniadriaticum]MCX2934636.1 catalase family peroxidase [Mycobacterium pinniadriaticum]MCX2941059.1 catalase family peroxidase [Mycobacterium pinniadriaticum]